MSTSGATFFAVSFLIASIALVIYSDTIHMNSCVTKTEQYVEYIKPLMERGAGNRMDGTYYLDKDLIQCLYSYNILYPELHRLQQKYNISIWPDRSGERRFFMTPPF